VGERIRIKLPPDVLLKIINSRKNELEQRFDEKGLMLTNQKVFEKTHEWLKDLGGYLNLQEAVGILAWAKPLWQSITEFYAQSYGEQQVLEALAKAMAKPRLQKKAAEMWHIIDKMSKFQSSLSQDDEGVWVRKFHLVKNKRVWEKLQNGVYDEMVDAGAVKLLLTIEIPKVTEKAQKAKKALEGQYRICWEILFGLRPIARYYVYIDNNWGK
jgi:hypothetical protein